MGLLSPFFLSLVELGRRFIWAWERKEEMREGEVGIGIEGYREREIDRGKGRRNEADNHAGC